MPDAQRALSGTNRHCPADEHSFVVQATLSSHSPALQQARHPSPAQQCVPAAQPATWHLPETQVLVVQGFPSSQPASLVHCTVGMQPVLGLQVLLTGHLPEFGR
jgi:hypothetical protein